MCGTGERGNKENDRGLLAREAPEVLFCVKIKGACVVFKAGDCKAVSLRKQAQLLFVKKGPRFQKERAKWAQKKPKPGKNKVKTGMTGNRFALSANRGYDANDVFFINRIFQCCLVVAEENISGFPVGSGTARRHAVYDKHSVCTSVNRDIADLKRKMCTGDTERITGTGKERKHAVPDRLDRNYLVFFQKRKQHGNRAALQRTIG